MPLFRRYARQLFSHRVGNAQPQRGNDRRHQDKAGERIEPAGKAAGVHARSSLLDTTRKTAEAVPTETRLRPKSKSSMTTTMALAGAIREAGCDPPAPPGQLRAAPAICFLTCSEKIEFFGFVLPKPSACP